MKGKNKVGEEDERYKDKNGIEVKEGDIIKFTFYDGEKNVIKTVRKDKEMNDFGISGLWPPLMKYLEFTIIQKHYE